MGESLNIQTVAPPKKIITTDCTDLCRLGGGGE